MRVCKTCGIEKDIEEFNRHAPSKEGRRLHCKVCQTIANRKWYKPRKRPGQKIIVDPIKKKANQAVNNAVRDGRLHRPDQCEECGQLTALIEGHHNSYEQEHWLNVEWLCRSCHGKRHRKY